ncbi:MAG: NAD(P)/FAD-dependent oxidoreductase [Cyanobacteria bacterium]|nr:NAD(P)/FAD-dependent oxidoreductase [Cyanobacteriota bacterium]
MRYLRKIDLFSVLTEGRQQQLAIGVIGAGPAGLTAAYLLSGADLDVNVWEADPHYVGGISRTEVYGGFRFDIGGHRFFSKSREVEDLWSQILPHDMLECERLSRIYYDGKFYSYPLDLAEVVGNLGKRQSLLTVASYFKAKLSTSSNPDNLEDWVTRKFGGRLYRMFFKSYTEKVWGMPCREISADWAAQRIKGLSLLKAARAALRPRRQTPRAGEVGRSDVIKSLITSFRYPRHGPGMLWEAAAAKIREQGGHLHMGTRVQGLSLTSSGRWRVKLALADGSERFQEVDRLISSAPLGWLVRNLEPSLPTAALEAASDLRYRDFLTVALILKSSNSFPDNWLYIHDPQLRVGRIQNFSNWSPEMVPDPSMVCYGMEYFCSQTDQLWTSSDAELIRLATRELLSLGLAQEGEVIDGAVVRQPKAYPVYDDDYTERRMIIRTALSEHCPGLHVVGRNGMHQYNNQDHSMMTAMLTARNILAGQELYDVWRVNQDADYIEERAVTGSAEVADQQLVKSRGF